MSLSFLVLRVGSNMNLDHHWATFPMMFASDLFETCMPMYIDYVVHLISILLLVCTSGNYLVLQLLDGMFAVTNVG